MVSYVAPKNRLKPFCPRGTESLARVAQTRYLKKKKRTTPVTVPCDHPNRTMLHGMIEVYHGTMLFSVVSRLRSSYLHLTQEPNFWRKKNESAPNPIINQSHGPTVRLYQ